MGKRKTATAVLALAFSLFSVSAAYAAEGQEEKALQYATYKTIPEDAESLHGEYIPVLMYHHFAQRDMDRGNGIVCSTKELEDHLRYFKSQGYQVISLERLDSLLDKAARNHQAKGMGLSLGEKYICITMDDGYYSNYDLAYPMFQKHRSPASVFVVTDYITNQIGLKKFNWDQAEKMDDAGWLRVYSHSADHVPVAAGQEGDFLSSMQRSEITLEEELSKDRVKAMAYPNGMYTEESKRLLEEDGYELQFTIESGVITRDTERSAIPRIMVSAGMTGEDLVRKIELTAERVFAVEREGN